MKEIKITENECAEQMINYYIPILTQLHKKYPPLNISSSSLKPKCSDGKGKRKMKRYNRSNDVFAGHETVAVSGNLFKIFF